MRNESIILRKESFQDDKFVNKKTMKNWNHIMDIIND